MVAAVLAAVDVAVVEAAEAEVVEEALLDVVVEEVVEVAVVEVVVVVAIVVVVVVVDAFCPLTATETPKDWSFSHPTTERDCSRKHTAQAES